MTYAELCKKFCEIEREYGLFDIEYEGAGYWKYARYYVYRVLLNKLYGIHTPWMEGENVAQVPKYNYWFQRFTDLVFHNIRTAKEKDILLFTFNRRVKRDGKYVSPVSDEIALNLKRSSCVVELPGNGGYLRPAPIRNIKYFDLWSRVAKVKKHDTNLLQIGRLRKQVLAPFEEELKIKFTREEKYRLVLNINFIITNHKALIDNYVQVIRKVNPKLVLVHSSYIGEWMILVEALKQLRIPSVEILHGYIDDNYLPYNYAERCMHEAQPDYILAYSQIQKEQVHWGIPEDRVRVVGFPEGEKRSAQLLAEVKKEKKRKRITFISSMQEQIVKYINKLAATRSFDEYEIVFKLHPNEYAVWRNIYNDLSERVQVIADNERDVHYYLANSDIVIGINSTALFEASFYPVDIFILKEESCQNMDILLKAGGAELVEDEEDLLFKIINRGREHKIENSFYERNAIENINREIETILKEKRM